MSGEDDAATRAAAAGVKEILGNPDAVTALSQKIAQFVGSIAPIPAEVQRRVHALKNLQVDFLKVESEFYKDVQLLEVKYMKQYQNILDKRKTIVTGEYEPSDKECEWSDEVEVKGEEGESSSSPATGIPEFWLTAMKSTDIFADMIKEHDEPALQSLVDIKVVYPTDSGMEFVLEFYFSENEWFTNSVLTKSYKMKSEVDEDEPFEFEGAAITSCQGCSIDWKKGKKLTIKTIKKKQKHKGAGQARMVTKTVPNESFFSFFSPPKLEEGKEGEEEEEEVSQQLSDDYARAEFIRDRLVPKAVLFFTGEMVDDTFDDMEEGEEEDDEEDEEAGNDSDLKDQVMVKPECKQQ